MTEKFLVFDFDGVLCDSLSECLLTSYTAYSRLFSTYPRTDYTDQTFRAMRPFVKSGEDYILIHLLIHQSIYISNQSAFDKMRAIHASQLPIWNTALYAERNRLLDSNPDFWLSLNPLFTGVQEMLIMLPPNRFHILSTKRADLIQKILSYHGVMIPPENITHSTAEGKLAHLTQLITDHGLSPSTVSYFEDQVEYLIETQSLGINVYLVSWGYHSTPEQKRANIFGIPMVDFDFFKSLL